MINNRSIIIKKFIDAAALKLAKIKYSINEAQETANNAPGPMQSASDTTKTEMNLLIGGFSEQQNSAQTLLKNLYALPEEYTKPDSVQSGAIVKISKADTEKLFFIIENSGGIEVENDGKKINGLSPNAPLAKSIYGLRVGESAQFNNVQIKILEII